MKKMLVIAGSLACGVSYAASPVFQPIGSSFTLGSSANPSALSTSLYNPAAPFLMVDTDEGDRFRFGIIGPGGFGYELGQVDSLTDEIDRLEKKLDETAQTAEAAQALKDDANNIVTLLGKDANGKLSTAGQIPFFPVIYKHPKYGSFTFDASLSAVGNGKFIDDRIDIVGDDTDGDGTDDTYILSTKSSIYTKYGTDLAFGFGYANDLWSNQHGMLIAGAKVNIHAVTLGKALLHLGAADEDGAEDYYADSLSDNGKTTIGASLDLGAIWTSEYYQFGITGTNLNEPTFEYGSLKQDCSQLASESVAQNNCYVVDILANQGRIALSEVHTMERQVTIDSAVFVDDKQWALTGAYDLFETSDLLGDKYQWAVAAASYHGENAWIPGFRIGYRKNMAGTELSYLTGGFTLFKRLNFDLAYGLESIEIDGTEAPRSLYVSAGIESAF
ncbi:hypothetical protein DN730_09440 [Marinomonas piezotolerans]|uniref:Type IX secretion system membrane protein PorP/SprF n=1 Tax=Marinomonas piezotolerans TaxID=2213058 RepID=A0A370UA16_9GAMM|nr:conjugal transfer protein TraF [Marinomonas piezotolerans]RDL44601.1 hypothetical protein DN730_09440 [Marinomonas piezotolerans]